VDLVESLLKGDRRAAARLISMAENRADGAEVELARLVPHTGRAHVVGVTGAPGSGKSTLVMGLAREFRARGKTVGIIAVDPTSPFSGGAVLGDRVRMQELSTDPGVFIRSMASRGALGGLARATSDALKVLDAFGCQVILVETVGAGQTEVDIARAAQTTVVVEIPGMGDEVQAIKAGILEIADVFAVNKADRTRADRVVQNLQMVLEARAHEDGWLPPIVKTVATTGAGVPELVDALESHLAYLRSSGEMERRLEENALRELMTAASERFVAELRQEVGESDLSSLARAIADRRLDAASAARELVKRFVCERSEIRDQRSADL
jgi:LAO/AO transport system kinase